MKTILLLIYFVFISLGLSAQTFSYPIGKSPKELTRLLGQPELKRQNKDGFIYLYNGRESGEKLTYAIQDNIVYMAIQSFPGLTLSQAKDKTDRMILLYLSEGYIKQGTQDGLTILKKGNKVLSAGYMRNDDGSYVTLITAFI